MTDEEYKIDRSDFEQWIKHPVTKDIMKAFLAFRDASIEEITNIIPIVDAQHHRQLYLHGRISAYNELLNTSYSDFQQIEKEIEK